MSSKSPKRGPTQNQAINRNGKGRHVSRESLLVDYVGKQVSVITNDGRNIVGCMKGFDQVCNVILEGCAERVFSCESGVNIIALGLHVIRGDNIAIVGEIDAEKDSKIAWNNLHVRSCSHPYLIQQGNRITDVELFRVLRESDGTAASLQSQGYTIKPVVH